MRLIFQLFLQSLQVDYVMKEEFKNANPLSKYLHRDCGHVPLRVHETDTSREG